MNYTITCYLFVPLECACSVGMIVVVHLGVPFFCSNCFLMKYVCMYMLICDDMTLLDENC
jgi:hypothetical protein